MNQHTSDFRKKVVVQHVRDGRTTASLSAEYGISKATVSNWVKAYRKECQTKGTVPNSLIEFLHILTVT